MEEEVKSFGVNEGNYGNMVSVKKIELNNIPEDKRHVWETYVNDVKMATIQLERLQKSFDNWIEEYPDLENVESVKRVRQIEDYMDRVKFLQARQIDFLVNMLNDLMDLEKKNKPLVKDFKKEIQSVVQAPEIIKLPQTNPMQEDVPTIRAVVPSEIGTAKKVVLTGKEARDRIIYEEYNRGTKTGWLAQKYNLTPNGVLKIVNKVRKKIKAEFRRIQENNVKYGIDTGIDTKTETVPDNFDTVSDKTETVSLRETSS